MKKHITLLLALALSAAVHAQEMFGMANSNYSGTLGTFLNPSTIVDAPYKFDINFMAADFFVGNNFLYIPSDKKALSRSLSGDLSNEQLLYHVEKDKRFSGYNKTLIVGPSFVYNHGKWAWAFHTALRSEFSVTKLPYHFGKLMFERFDYNNLWNENLSSKPFSSAFMSWGELGGTYGRVFMDTEKDYIKWAGTAKLLYGMNGGFLDVRAFEYTVQDSANVIINNLDATLAHALPEENFSAGSMLGGRGFGLGADFGITYIHNRSRAAYDCNKTSDYFSKYQYRIGLSFIDLGYIRFNRQTNTVNLNTSNNVLFDGIDTASIHSMEDLDYMLSSKINGLYNESELGFTMLLPSAVSLQVDYRLMRRLYANATFINRLHFAGNQIARSNQMSWSVRYERKIIEPNLSLNFYEYAKPSLGFALRNSFFVIGTDRLLEWFSLTDMYSANLYFGFKINFCEFGKKSTCIAYGNME